MFDLTSFELPPALVRPIVEACRLFNGTMDEIFYDVPGLRAALALRDRTVTTMQGHTPPSRVIDFDALRDPEGCLLLINPQVEPYVRRFLDVESFLASPHEEAQRVAIATITGVGSSALGSAAFAWAVAAAKHQPVLAIVPGYGMADIIEQALGGWFGFGLHDWLQSKASIQASLAVTAPKIAAIGRGLSASAPNAKTLNEAPVFRFGSGSSDVLHDLMAHRATPFRMLVGHSKGALQIGNAIKVLAAETTQGLEVVTLGCPIAEDVPGVIYDQYLGILDGLGQLNAWGNRPGHWPWSWHTTNPHLPPAMPVSSEVERTAGMTSPR